MRRKITSRERKESLKEIHTDNNMQKGEKVINVIMFVMYMTKI